MKVNISSIREIRGGSIQFQGEQEIDSIREIEELGLILRKPASVTGKVTNTGEGFLVKAEVVFAYEANCSRCLEHFQAKQTIVINEEFVSDYQAGEDETVFGFHGDIIDLGNCINEQIVLALPMKFLCRADCRGFCPVCGTNLNQEECHCSEQKIDSRFEKLKSLLPKEGGGSNG